MECVSCINVIPVYKLVQIVPFSHKCRVAKAKIYATTAVLHTAQLRGLKVSIPVDLPKLFPQMFFASANLPDFLAQVEFPVYITLVLHQNIDQFN